MRNKNLILFVAGGIGNQLFMYAAAKRLAKINNVNLLLDVFSGFERDSYKQIYQLNKFFINADIAPQKLTFHGRWGDFSRNFIKRINKFLPYDRRWLIKEDIGFDGMTSFDKRLLDLSLYHTNTYMVDCFQCEKYFSDIRDELLNEFRVSTPLSKKTTEIASLILNTNNSVAIHARQLRGAPHIEGAVVPADIKQKPYSYYETGIRYIIDQVNSPTFFCFGDDPKWLEKNWNFDYPVTFISHNNSQEKAVEDFYLIGLCEHFIIGNSTFSWWPAWLSPNKDKIVIAPKNKKPHLWSGNKDVIPSEWLNF